MIRALKVGLLIERTNRKNLVALLAVAVVVFGIMIFINALEVGQQLDEKKSDYYTARAVLSKFQVIGEVKWSDFKHIKPEDYDETKITPTKTFGIFNNARAIITYMNDSHCNHVILTDHNKFVGFITKDIIMDKYRTNLKKLRIE